ITQPNKYDPRLVPALVEDTYKFVVPNVLAPMDKVDFAGKPDVSATVKIEQLRGRLGQLRARPKRNTLLFANVPQTTIDFPPPKKEAPAPPKEPEKKEPPKKEPEKKRRNGRRIRVAARPGTRNNRSNRP